MNSSRRINNNGGDRASNSLPAEIPEERASAGGTPDQSGALWQIGGSSVTSQLPADASDFAEQRDRFKSRREEDRERDADLQNSLTEHEVTLRQGKQQHDELSAEISSLKGRRSNIEAQQIQIREAFVRSTGIQRRRNAVHWRTDPDPRRTRRRGKAPPRGVLRSFRAHIACTRFTLHGGLRNGWTTVVSGVFWCHCQCRQARKAGNLPEQHRDSVVRKLQLKSNSPHYDWLERELAHRFNFACCVTQEQFRRGNARGYARWADQRSKRPPCKGRPFQHR